MRRYLLNVVAIAVTTIAGMAAISIHQQFAAWFRWSKATAETSGEVRSTESFSESPSDPNLPKSLSPYDVAIFINTHPSVDLSKLWHALRIDPEQFNGASANGDFFPRGCDRCEAELFEYDFDGRPGTEVLMRISPPFDQSCRYLVFTNSSEGWKVVGHIDAWSKYRKPFHTIILSKGRAWLAIRNQGASGSGVASYFDIVYLVTTSKVIPAFSYVSDGSQYGGPNSANREFSGVVMDCTLTDNVVRVLIHYSVNYGGERAPLFRKTQRVIFSQRLGSQREVFDRVNSDLTQQELESVYNVDTLSNEDFLKYNYKELSEIAAGRDLSRKEWLRSFLKTCDHTIEHRRLQGLLAAGD